MEKIRQVALFQSKDRQKMERWLNDTYEDLAKKKFNLVDTKIWNSIIESTRSPIWFATVDFEVDYETLTGESDSDERDRKIAALKSYNYNSELTLNQLGYDGCKAFILQNLLEDVNIDLPYYTLMKIIKDKYDFDADTPVKEFSNVEIVEVNLNLDNK
jgi:hypothetical protein